MFSKKKFSRNSRKSHCCRFTRVCSGKKCKNIKRGCFWFGKKNKNKYKHNFKMESYL